MLFTTHLFLFVVSLIRVVQLISEEFRKIDRDSNNSITKDELIKVLALHRIKVFS